MRHIIERNWYSQESKSQKLDWCSRKILFSSRNSYADLKRILSRVLQHIGREEIGLQFLDWKNIWFFSYIWKKSCVYTIFGWFWWKNPKKVFHIWFWNFLNKEKIFLPVFFNSKKFNAPYATVVLLKLDFSKFNTSKATLFTQPNKSF